MSGRGRRRIGEFLIGANEDAVAAYNNEFDGMYSFTHIWKLPPPPANNIVNYVFNTTVSPVALQWGLDMSISDTQGVPSRLVCYVFGSSNIGSTGYSGAECTMQARRLLKNGKEETISDIDQCERTLWDNVYPQFKSRLMSDASSETVLGSYYYGSPYDAECTWEICVTLKVPVAAFRFDSSFSELTPLPAAGYPDATRFANFYDRSQHDFLFECTDGVVMAGSEILTNASESLADFFRSPSGQTRNRREINAPVLVVNLLLTYIVTGHFRLNHVDLTPQFADAFFQLLYNNVNSRDEQALLNVFETCCSLKALEVGQNLDALMPWLYVGVKWYFLEHCPLFGATCKALLIDGHWNDYIREYIDNQATDPAKAQLRRQLLELLDEGEPSVHEALCQFKRNSISAVVPVNDD